MFSSALQVYKLTAYGELGKFQQSGSEISIFDQTMKTTRRVKKQPNISEKTIDIAMPYFKGIVA